MFSAQEGTAVYRIRRSLTTSLLILLFLTGARPALAQERAYEVYKCKVWLCADTRRPRAVTGVRNLQNEQWWRDLEVEVKNTSDKPIYYIGFLIALPDTGSPKEGSPKSDGMWGVHLNFGRPALGDVRAGRAEAGDLPLEPGESYVFKIPENVQGTFSRRPESHARKVLLEVVEVSFGDGTGFVAGGVAVRR